jgi:hypothetical protein
MLGKHVPELCEQLCAVGSGRKLGSDIHVRPTSGCGDPVRAAWAPGPPSPRVGWSELDVFGCHATRPDINEHDAELSIGDVR